MKVLTKDYLLELENGQIWSIPVRVIAFHRAHYYEKKDDISFHDSLYKDTLPLFESDDYEIEDWAKNCMNWADVKIYAKLIPHKCCMDKEWAEGKVTIS